MKEKKGKRPGYIPLLDRKGKAEYFLDPDKIHIYSMEGQPVAFIEKEAIYDFSGRHLGWFEEGWARDLQGRCVAFTEEARGSGPSKPKRAVHLPVPGEKKDPPPHPEIGERPRKPVKVSAWSELSPQALFL